MQIERTSLLAKLLVRFTTETYLHIHVNRYNTSLLNIKPGPDFWYINGSIIVFALIGAMIVW